MPDTGTPRLSAFAGAKLPYRREAVTPGIVHLGVGAFHRAHMAVYVDDLLASDPGWGIVGASLRRSETRQALAPQDFLYTVALKSGAGTTYRTVGALLDVLDATHQRDELLAAMADPRIRIVSLTVTEKGYCHDPATGTLDERHSDIVHDLANPGEPVTAPGLIVRALEMRREAGTAPFTVLSCDNLPANGRTAARIVTRLAEMRDKALGAYIVHEVAFPSTMIDRIVPATTDADREAVYRDTGFADAWPVVTEPFTQWVIEDRFPGGRPAFEHAGAQLVEDVAPFELMKLRMLNGAHSTLAYLGYLAGCDYVSEAIACPAFRTLIHRLMSEEAMETLPSGLGDLNAYRDALPERFANPALKHRTWQIAMDGSQKLPQRLLATIRDRLAEGRSITLCALGVAAWMRYVSGIDENGGKIDVRDPLAGHLRSIWAETDGGAERIVAGFLELSEVFGKDLPQNESFRSTLSSHLRSLQHYGALATARKAIGV